jgi:hypothetical protein
VTLQEIKDQLKQYHRTTRWCAFWLCLIFLTLLADSIREIFS